MGELRKAGVRVNLQEQPLKVLECLVERAGELVTREELRQRLWQGDTFVDFEHGVNAAVKRLRGNAWGLGRDPAIHRDPAAPRLSADCAGGTGPTARRRRGRGWQPPIAAATNASRPPQSCRRIRSAGLTASSGPASWAFLLLSHLQVGAGADLRRIPSSR